MKYWNYVKQHMPAWAWLPIAAVLGIGGANYSTLASLFSSPMKPSELMSKPDAEGTVFFTPRAGIKLQSGKILLNDRKDYTDPGTVCLVIDPKICTPPANDPKAMFGRPYKVLARSTSFNGKPQLEAISIAPAFKEAK